MKLPKILTRYDYFERHTVVSQLLRQAVGNDQPEDDIILDVGGCVRALERFASHPVVSINPDHSGNLRGDGRALPFPANCFVAAVSIDTLEHLPKKDRLDFLRECLRVAQCCVIIAAPFGSQGHGEYETRLNRLYESVYGEPLEYLTEHSRYGLPDAEEITALGRELGAASIQQFFAGNYVRQGRQFEQALLGHRRRGLLGRLLNAYNYISSLAVFHPIQLRDQPESTTNRIYLLIEKKHPDI
jgi:hypothetical protein